MADPPRVLHVIDDLERGGAQAVVLATAHLAPQAGWEMHVAGLSGRVDSALAGELAAQAASVSTIGARGLWDVRAVARLVALIRRTRVDLVHTHLAHADVMGGLAARLTGRPVVSTLHAVAADRATIPWRRRRVAATATRHLSGRLVAVSAAVRDTHVDALGIDRSRFAVLRNIPLAPLVLGRDFDPLAWRAALGLGARPFVATAARLAPPKDHDTLLRAWPAVLERHPDALLVVAGDGPQREELRALTRSLSLEEAVRFLGVRADVPYLLSAADVVCNLTHEGEGLSITVLDAMSLGRPVVATGVESVREVIRDGRSGVLVAPRDVDGVSSALVELLADERRRRQMGGEAQRDCAARMDPHRWIAGLTRVYSEGLAGAER